MKKGALRSFSKLTEKHLRQSLFFNKAADLGVQLSKAATGSCSYEKVSLTTSDPGIRAVLNISL